MGLAFGKGNEGADYCLKAWAKTAAANDLDAADAKRRVTLLADIQGRGHVKSVLKYGQALMAATDADIKDFTDTVEAPKTRFASYDQRDYDTDEFAEFERKLLQS